MPYGDAIQDKCCAHCHQALAIPLIYRDGVWYHAVCFHEGTQPWRQTMLRAAAARSAPPRAAS